MRMMRVNTTAVVYVSELETQVPLREGETVDVDSDEGAAIYREHAWVFNAGTVEQATAGPGEKRSTRRPA